MSILKLLVPAAAALALAACATTTEQTAAGKAEKTFVGKWEVKAKTPFRDEDGAIPGYGEDTGLTAVAGASKPRS